MNNNGAFVELDQHKLSRDELVLLGMKDAHDKWIDELRSQAAVMEHPGARSLLNEIADRMAAVRDNIAVVLTKAAIKSKSGVLHNLKAEV